MTDAQLRAPIEAILMVAAEPVSVHELAGALEADTTEVEETLRALARDYLGQGEGPERGFELREVAGGWRIYSARAYADIVGRFVVGSAHARLSQAALETLAVIAYRQPISRTLLARGLVEETGATPSGARLYGTTGEFLAKMGMMSLSELVPLAPYLPNADALDELEEEL